MSPDDMFNEMAKFAASYNYNADFSDARSMIISGGGNCWASSLTICTICEKLGIKAWKRPPDRLYSYLHENAMAYYDGIYYEMEAGYTGNAPRRYNVKKYTSPCIYVTEQESYGTVARIIMYEGFNVDTSGNVVIPSVVDNNIPVTFVGFKSFCNYSQLKSVTIPDSVKELFSNAFYRCSNLENVTIEGNGLEEIESEAFLDTPSLKSITLPKSVKKIGTHAFGYSKSDSKYELNKGFVIYGYSGTAAETYAKNNNIRFVSIG